MKISVGEGQTCSLLMYAVRKKKKIEKEKKKEECVRQEKKKKSVKKWINVPFPDDLGGCFEVKAQQRNTWPLSFFILCVE